MTTNITTLALNLLISERITQRNLFADRILELIQDTKGEAENKREFLNVIYKCVENPNHNESRNLFFHLAQHYNEKIYGNDGLTSAA